MKRFERAVVVAAIVAGLLLLAPWVLRHPARERAEHLRGQLEETRAENEQLRRENARLLQEIRALGRDPRLVERHAREDLRFARQDELILRFEGGSSDAPRGDEEETP